MPEYREMFLGYSGLGLQQLDSYQRHVIGERIYGYCIYPNSDHERRLYQLCLSFYRQWQLNPKNSDPNPDLFDLQVDNERQKEYLAEELAFFGSLGGTNAFLDSQGHDFYLDRTQDMLRIAFAIGAMTVGLAAKGGAAASKAQGARYLEDLGILVARKKGLQEKRPMTTMKFQPKLGPMIGPRGLGNERYLRDAIQEYSSVHPLLTATIATLWLYIYRNKTDSKALTYNAFGCDAESFIGIVLGYEGYLPTVKHPNTKSFLSTGDFWRLPNNLVKTVRKAGIKLAKHLGEAKA